MDPKPHPRPVPEAVPDLFRLCSRSLLGLHPSDRPVEEAFCTFRNARAGRIWWILSLIPDLFPNRRPVGVSRTRLEHGGTRFRERFPNRFPGGSGVIPKRFPGCVPECVPSASGQRRHHLRSWRTEPDR